MLNDDFIAVHEKLMTSEECKDLINLFHVTRELGLTQTRQEMNDMAAHQKNDETFFVHASTIHKPMQPVIRKFTDRFWEKVYAPYVEQYSVLKFTNQFGIPAMRLQCTKPTQGFHIWHFENGSQIDKGRILVLTLYLNDVEEGGETEFLYLSKRIKPQEGTCLLWPAGFTHTHRGNPPLKGDKYILTGWIEWAAK